ncbi:MAG: carboxypeptidase-like regulatory domain-containing protein [Acidobacteria bacterium]|nr:carboxypeptidase-like regulatory domain-containing protein [Acidobacteriota bacterium]
MKTVILGLVLACLAFPRPADAAQRMTTLQIVVRDASGDPVPRASVIVRTVKGKKKNKVTDTLQLKTSEQGTAPVPPLRQGYILLQVHAAGYQTFGDTIELTEVEQTVAVTLKPPQEQVSVK